MEQKVAPGTGLTARQKQFLELVRQEPYLRSNFYLSGGTALALWYLHHRESFDLDFFTCRPFDDERITHWVRANRKSIGYRLVHIDEDFGFLTITFHYPDDTFLKIDFNHYTEARLKKGLVWRGIEIDSLYDIAVNKLETISSSPRTRDYVDLYYILQSTKFKIKDLMQSVGEKFSERIDTLQLIKNFLKVVEYTDLPRMLIPFDRKDMDRYYANLARSLKKEVFI